LIEPRDELSLVVQQHLRGKASRRRSWVALGLSASGHAEREAEHERREPPTARYPEH
jgi:hypothetical protein